MTSSYLSIEVEAERRRELLARPERSHRHESPAEALEPRQLCAHEPSARSRHLAADPAGQASAA